MADVLHGNSSGNQLNVGANRTQAYGLSGNDTLASDGKSNVLLVGGSGDDSLIMSGGNGTLSGGKGNDTFVLNYSATQTLSAVIEDVEPSNDSITVNFDGTVMPALSSVVSGNDLVLSDSGGRLNVTLKGVRDNDYFDGTGNAEQDEHLFEILKLTNDEREKPTTVEGHESITAEAKNLPWLTLSDGLTKAASIRAEEIAKLGASGNLDVYKHNRPNGTVWYTVFDDIGKHYPNKGENITAGASTASGAMEDLINSPSHHKNILNIQPEDDSHIDYLKLGVGYEFVPEVEVDSNGKRNHHYWEPLFGGSLSAGEMETVSTADLLTVSIATDTISKAVIGNDDDNILSNGVLGATIDGGGSSDYIYNEGVKAFILGGTGNDTLYNEGDHITLSGGAGNDSIRNEDGSFVSITGDAGDDSVVNFGENVTLNGGKDDDYILNRGDNVTIDGDTGDDTINLSSSAENNLIIYKASEGNDSISGFDSNDTLSIFGTYSAETVGSDVILTVGNGSVSLVGAATVNPLNIMNNANYIALTEGNDTYNNTVDGVTISALGGDDTIENGVVGPSVIGVNVSIGGAEGNDSILNYGDSVTIDSGTGSDNIANNAFNDSISGNEGNDTIENTFGSNVTIDGSADNDSISNRGSSNVIIIGGIGSDYISNRDFASSSSNSVTIYGGAGYDTIGNSSSYVTINGGEGNESITNGTINSPTVGTNVLINGDEDNDFIGNYGENVTINGGMGNDIIRNNSGNITINGGAGDDNIGTSGNSISINGGDDNDTVNNIGSLVTIEGGIGNDSIINEAASVSIYGGDGTDTIYNNGSNVTILGGRGNDAVSLSSGAANSFIQYLVGDGYDTIWGITENDTVNLPEAAELNSANSRITSLSNPENDLIIRVRTNGVITGEISLVGGMKHPPHFTFGDSKTDGSGSIDNDSGDNSSSGSGGDGSGSGGGNTSGGTSAGEGHGSDASGNASAAGRGDSGGASGGGDGGGGSSFIRSRHTRRYGNNTTSTISDEARRLYNEMLSQAEQPSAAAQHVYTGGNQVISNYQSGEKIIFAEQYTGAFYDGAGNFIAGSSTGALAIENATDKVIDLSDAAGNDFVKAYAATTAGLIDGRGIAGFELINGSAGGDVIYAGDGGSQLWGGADVAADALFGGGGSDIFVGGRTQGADVFLNASSADVVHLNDATLSDIVATAEDNGVVAVAFNTGNVISAQSTEALSSTFMLADGSAYRYNHINKSWQNA